MPRPSIAESFFRDLIAKGSGTYKELYEEQFKSVLRHSQA